MCYTYLIWCLPVSLALWTPYSVFLPVDYCRYPSVIYSLIISSYPLTVFHIDHLTKNRLIHYSFYPRRDSRSSSLASHFKGFFFFFFFIDIISKSIKFQLFCPIKKGPDLYSSDGISANRIRQYNRAV